MVRDCVGADRVLAGVDGAWGEALGRRSGRGFCNEVLAPLGVEVEPEVEDGQLV